MTYAPEGGGIAPKSSTMVVNLGWKLYAVDTENFQTVEVNWKPALNSKADSCLST
jgi:hypothetical protein